MECRTIGTLRNLISHKAATWVCNEAFRGSTRCLSQNSAIARHVKKLAKTCKKICRLVTKSAKITSIVNYKRNVMKTCNGTQNNLDFSDNRIWRSGFYLGLYDVTHPQASKPGNWKNTKTNKSMLRKQTRMNNYGSHVSPKGCSIFKCF